MATNIDIEKVKTLCEEHYRQDNPTAEVEIAFGYVDYIKHPIIVDYEERGYRLYDTYTFVHGAQWGEVLVFVKKNETRKA